jgi:acetylornithine deacetylase
MTIDPFGAAIANSRLSGRGACDIKGGMAAMLGAFARLVRERPRGAANVLMACTVDEEFTFLGVQRLVKGLKADGAVVAEPTQLQIVNAHKGVVRWHLHATGRACHSSSPERGINAIYRMGKLLGAIEQYAERLRQSRTDPVLGPPTLSVGLIEGGTSVNTVPDRCKIEIDRRLVSGEDPQTAPDDLEEFLRNQAKLDFPYEIQRPWMAMPSLVSKHSGDLTARLGRAIASVRGSFAVTAVPYGTDASTIAQAGVPAVVFGPGDIAQAHTCDEWVSLAEVEEASEILFRFAQAN